LNCLWRLSEHPDKRTPHPLAISADKSGIGLATAKQFVNEGVYVFLNRFPNARAVATPDVVKVTRKQASPEYVRDAQTARGNRRT